MGESGELPVNDVQIVFERTALVFEHGILNYPFVETQFGLYVPGSSVWFQGLRPIGHYRFITRVDGTVDDDYLVLDKPGYAANR